MNSVTAKLLVLGVAAQAIKLQQRSDHMLSQIKQDAQSTDGTVESDPLAEMPVEEEPADTGDDLANVEEEQEDLGEDLEEAEEEQADLGEDLEEAEEEVEEVDPNAVETAEETPATGTPAAGTSAAGTPAAGTPAAGTQTGGETVSEIKNAADAQAAADKAKAEKDRADAKVAAEKAEAERLEAEALRAKEEEEAEARRAKEAADAAEAAKKAAEERKGKVGKITKLGLFRDSRDRAVPEKYQGHINFDRRGSKINREPEKYFSKLLGGVYGPMALRGIKESVFCLQWGSEMWVEMPATADQGYARLGKTGDTPNHHRGKVFEKPFTLDTIDGEVDMVGGGWENACYKFTLY